jgi:hypothetical protein
MTATPPIVDRETWQKQTDTQRVREKAHTREGTQLPRLAGGSRWSRSTRRRRWSAPPARSRSSTPSRSRSQQFALGSVGGSLARHVPVEACLVTGLPACAISGPTRLTLGRSVEGTILNGAVGLRVTSQSVEATADRRAPGLRKGVRDEFGVGRRVRLT